MLLRKPGLGYQETESCSLAEHLLAFPFYLFSRFFFPFKFHVFFPHHHSGHFLTVLLTISQPLSSQLVIFLLHVQVQPLSTQYQASGYMVHTFCHTPRCFQTSGWFGTPQQQQLDNGINFSLFSHHLTSDGQSYQLQSEQSPLSASSSFSPLTWGIISVNHFIVEEKGKECVSS